MSSAHYRKHSETPHARTSRYSGAIPSATSRPRSIYADSQLEQIPDESPLNKRTNFYLSDDAEHESTRSTTTDQQSRNSFLSELGHASRNAELRSDSAGYRNDSKGVSSTVDSKMRPQSYTPRSESEYSTRPPALQPRALSSFRNDYKTPMRRHASERDHYIQPDTSSRNSTWKTPMHPGYARTELSIQSSERWSYIPQPEEHIEIERLKKQAEYALDSLRPLKRSILLIKMRTSMSEALSIREFSKEIGIRRQAESICRDLIELCMELSDPGFSTANVEGDSPSFRVASERYLAKSGDLGRATNPLTRSTTAASPPPLSSPSPAPLRYPRTDHVDRSRRDTLTTTGYLERYKQTRSRATDYFDQFSEGRQGTSESTGSIDLVDRIQHSNPARPDDTRLNGQLSSLAESDHMGIDTSKLFERLRAMRAVRAAKLDRDYKDNNGNQSYEDESAR
ncbi:hypothetical protein CANCADRAFT_3680 [Tortispora caseinolytica NRRL Y-17796]|uniref:Uncharacterized protein n=1 Tax=Tortispora caseinolytica NRRL Y-17796 TaxID=767744 RepID=A0A1E4TB85_9ASCO|nr:hypothetical protein CANCADRAFT_3680 [Tortispora caseinolytica NRRL Y-17796]